MNNLILILILNLSKLVENKLNCAFYNEKRFIEFHKFEEYHH